MVDITSIATIVLSAATVILAVGTIYYAKKTADLVVETRKARELEIQPIIKAFFVFVGPTYVELRIQNIGKGTAMDTDAKIIFEPTGTLTERIWKDRVLVPSSFRDFLLYDYGILEKIGSQLTEVRVKGTCRDIQGGAVTFEEVINTAEFSRNIKAAGQVYEDSFEDHVKAISKSTDSINDKLESIAKELRVLSRQISTNQTRTGAGNNE